MHKSLTQPGEISWHASSDQDVMTRLGTRPDGLNDGDVTEKLQRFGANTLARNGGASPWLIFWRQINNPIGWLLFAAGALAIALKKPTDAAPVRPSRNQVVPGRGAGICCKSFVELAYRSDRCYFKLVSSASRLITKIRQLHQRQGVDDETDEEYRRCRVSCHPLHWLCKWPVSCPGVSITLPAACNSQGKIDLTIQESNLIRNYAPDSTNLDVGWTVTSKSMPKFLARGDLFSAYKLSLENAVRGAGYEISGDGKKVSVQIIANSGLYKEGGLNITRDLAVGASINIGAAFSGLGPLFTPATTGGIPCTSLISLFSEVGVVPQMDAMRGCKSGFKTERTYKKTMAEALQKTQEALVQYLNKL